MLLASLLPEDLGGINPYRTMRRQDGREENHGHERDAYNEQDRCIECSPPVQHRCQRARRPSADERTGAQSDRRKDHAGANDDPQYLTLARSERHANSDLSCAAAYHQREHPVDSNRRQQERDDAKCCREVRKYARLRKRAVDMPL